MLDRGLCQAEIARRLGRSRSTISREVRRRSWRPSNTSAAYPPYRPAHAPHAVKSITADNGSEFAYHHKLADSVGVPTYFAVPYSAWQRGTNEHFNGRIRKYIPKRTRLDTITEINNRPRKILNWHTPAEIFN